jgi:predicted dehydrogenase
LFAEKYKCKEAKSISQIIMENDIDVVIVATRHDSLAIIALQLINSRKHVFIEKPGALNSNDFDKILKAKESFPDAKIHIGYNHRFHKGIREALKIYQSGQIGELMFIRARYGHGGRLGYETEWRASKDISGGGELIDQGSHLIDLAFAFLGDLKIDYAAIPTYFWKMNVEDNAFLSLSNIKGNIAFLHASCTEWKNMFSLEVYCKFGKIEVAGLGGSYGLERLTLYKMKPEMGPPQVQNWEFPGEDDSWELEIQEFLQDIKNNTNHSNNLESSKKVLDIISEIYKGK